MQIGILETGRSGEALIETFGTYVDFFKAFLTDPQQQTEFVSFSVFQGQFPDSTHCCDAYVITGSANGVHDGLPWIEKLKTFIVEASAKYKIFGCCFGHQVIAEAFGGQVAKAPQGWGIGYHTYKISHAQPWMSPRRNNLTLLASHQDQVVLPPPSAKILAGSTFCRIGMFSIGDTVMTTQLHPEFPRAFAKELYQQRRQIIGQEQVDLAIKSLKHPGDEEVFNLWVRNFLFSPACPL